MEGFDDISRHVHLWSAGEAADARLLSRADRQGGMPHFTVLGDMFIKNHYVVLSYEGNKPQVGLGERTDLPLIV
jgi:hypothetical protein